MEPMMLIVKWADNAHENHVDSIPIYPMGGYDAVPSALYVAHAYLSVRQKDYEVLEVQWRLHVSLLLH